MYLKQPLGWVAALGPRHGKGQKHLGGDLGRKLSPSTGDSRTGWELLPVGDSAGSGGLQECLAILPSPSEQGLEKLVLLGSADPS